jgi:hypothetical protein
MSVPFPSATVYVGSAVPTRGRGPLLKARSMSGPLWILIIRNFRKTVRSFRTRSTPAVLGIGRAARHLVSSR